VRNPGNPPHLWLFSLLFAENYQPPASGFSQKSSAAEDFGTLGTAAELAVPSLFSAVSARKPQLCHAQSKITISFINIT
jgi:hypothetical protein